MIDNTIITSILVHLFTALLQLVFWRKTVTHRVLSIAGSLVGVFFAFLLFSKVQNGPVLTMNAGNWEAPFGIVFVADLLSTTFVLLTSIVALAVSIFSSTGVARARMLYGYFPIFHFLIMGLNGAFLTGDIFNLYVWFEVIIISSFVLLTLGGRKAQLEGAVKYMALNILASTFFLTGIGILYGITGSLNMADLALKVDLVENQAIVNLTAIFFLVGFGIKAAVFPLYFWLPASYHTPPSAVAAVFGGLLTKVGIYAMLRIFTLIFIPDEFIRTLLIAIGILSVITGALGAFNKVNIRRLFAYLIVCHLGFVVGGIGLYTHGALLGAMFYLIHDIVIKTNVFLMTGLIRQLRGTMNIHKLGGLYKQYPKLSLLLAVVLFSLAGIPPLSGFWPKIYLLEAAFIQKNYAFILSLIFGSFLTLYLIAKVWAEAFWKQPVEDAEIVDNFARMGKGKKALLVLPIGMLAGASLFIGLQAETIIKVADQISFELLNPSIYIEAVLGK